MSDYIALVVQAQHGTPTEKHTAFNELVAQFHKMVFYQAYRTLDDAHLAEDVAQEVFLSAYQHLDQLQEPAAFPTWLKRIVMTHCDRQTRRKIPPTQELLEEMTSDAADLDTLYETHTLQTQVQQAIAALPAHERAVTESFYLQGESQQEIADKLQIPLTTVKKRLQYAREHLRLLIADLNAAMDEVVTTVIPQPAPPKMQKEPVYVYSRRRRPPTEE